MMERTLGIIKPDAVRAGNSGKIIDIIEKSGLEIIAMKKISLSKNQAETFYEIHKDKPFYDSLTKFMSDGKVIPMVIQGDDAIKRYRQIMGATDSSKAEKGTIRNLCGTDIEHNAVHGSDAPKTAKEELGFFFCGYELI